MSVSQETLLAEALGRKPQRSLCRRLLCLLLILSYFYAVVSLATADYRILVLRDRALVQSIQQTVSISVMDPSRAILKTLVFQTKRAAANYRQFLPILSITCAGIACIAMYASRRQWR